MQWKKRDTRRNNIAEEKEGLSLNNRLLDEKGQSSKRRGRIRKPLVSRSSSGDRN